MAQKYLGFGPVPPGYEGYVPPAEGPPPDFTFGIYQKPGTLGYTPPPTQPARDLTFGIYQKPGTLGYTPPPTQPARDLTLGVSPTQVATSPGVAGTKSGGFADYYTQALKDATDQYGTILKGYQDREASAIAQSQGFGQTKLRDTAEAYQARGGQLDQQAISRGLGNTTVRNTMQQGNFNAGQRSLSAVREENAREQLGIYGQYSGDTLGYAASGGAALRQFGLQGQQLSLQERQLAQQGSQFDQQFARQLGLDQLARLGGGGGGGGSSGGGSRSSGGGSRSSGGSGSGLEGDKIQASKDVALISANSRNYIAELNAQLSRDLHQLNPTHPGTDPYGSYQDRDFSGDDPLPIVGPGDYDIISQDPNDGLTYFIGSTDEFGNHYA